MFKFRKTASVGVSLLLIAGGLTNLNISLSNAADCQCDPEESHTTRSLAEAQQHPGYEVHQMSTGETEATNLSAEEVENMKKLHPGLVVEGSHTESYGLPDHEETVEEDNLTAAEEIEEESKLEDQGFNVVELNGGAHTHSVNRPTAAEVDDTNLGEAAAEDEAKYLSANGWLDPATGTDLIKPVKTGSVKVPGESVYDHKFMKGETLESYRAFRDEMEAKGYLVSEPKHADYIWEKGASTFDRVKEDHLSPEDAARVKAELETQGYSVTISAPHHAAARGLQPTRDIKSKEKLSEMDARDFGRWLEDNKYSQITVEADGSRTVKGLGKVYFVDPSEGTMTADFAVSLAQALTVDRWQNVQVAASGKTRKAAGEPIHLDSKQPAYSPYFHGLTQDAATILANSLRNLNIPGLTVNGPTPSGKNSPIESATEWNHTETEYYQKTKQQTGFGQWVGWSALQNVFKQWLQPTAVSPDRKAGDNSPNGPGDVRTMKVGDYIKLPGDPWKAQMDQLLKDKIINNDDTVKFTRGDYKAANTIMVDGKLANNPALTGWRKEIIHTSNIPLFDVEFTYDATPQVDVPLYTVTAEKANPDWEEQLYKVSGEKTVENSVQEDEVSLEAVRENLNGHEVELFNAEAEKEVPNEKEVPLYEVKAMKFYMAPQEEIVFDIMGTKMAPTQKAQEVFNVKWANNEVYYTYKTQNCHELPTETPNVKNVSANVKELPKTGLNVAALFSILSGLLLLGLVSRAAVMRRLGLRRLAHKK